MTLQEFVLQAKAIAGERLASVAVWYSNQRNQIDYMISGIGFRDISENTPQAAIDNLKQQFLTGLIYLSGSILPALEHMQREAKK